MAGHGATPADGGVFDGIIVRSPWRRNNVDPLTCGPNPAPGVFANNVPQPTSFAKITDGASKTLLVAEKYVFINSYSGGSASDDRGWLDGWDPDTMRSTCTYPLQDSQQNDVSTPTGAQHETFLFGSAHSSAFNSVFADGSVHSINYDVDLHIFNSLGTRNGESVGETSDMEGVN
jgi:hypothetical protein